MRPARFAEHGGPELLTVDEIERPEVRSHRVLVEVAAAGARVVGTGESDPVVGFSDDGVARSKDVSYQFMSLFNAPDMGAILERVAHLLTAADLGIEVARTYDLEGARQAQIDVPEDSFLGKLVLTP